MSEGALFKNQVGAAWARAAPNIRARFDRDPPQGQVVRYRGRMETVECSWLGKAMGWLVQRTGALTPHEGRDVDVDIDVWSGPPNGAVYKKRVYEFGQGRRHVFNSRMELEPGGALAEHVGGGFGMYVVVEVESDALRFRDDGYFFEAAGWRIPIPRVLGPGHVRLWHRDRGPREFGISIDITHPWFGRLFWQEGVFRHCEGQASMDAAHRSGDDGATQRPSTSTSCGPNCAL
jgi:hypothetical protein